MGFNSGFKGLTSNQMVRRGCPKWYRHESGHYL